LNALARCCDNGGIEHWTGEGKSLVSQQLLGRMAIRARQIRPGEGFGVEVKKDQFLQIITVEGQQVADFVAIAAGDPGERSSTGVTRAKNSSIMLQSGMKIYSNRRNAMFELVEDTVGRHDLLFAACDPRRYKDDFNLEGHANCRDALYNALGTYGLSYDDIPDPVNWFMNVSIQQRGELEVRESLAEKNDYVLLRAEMDVIAGISACPQDQNATNGGNPSDLLIRVFK
jgi:uncharacterized protein YcgI (DUF1989 family)